MANETGLPARLDAAVQELRDAIDAAPPNEGAFCGSWIGADGLGRSIDLVVGHNHICNVFVPPQQKEQGE